MKSKILSKTFTQISDANRYLTEEIFGKNKTINNMVMTSQGIVQEVTKEGSYIWLKDPNSKIGAYFASPNCYHPRYTHERLQIRLENFEKVCKKCGIEYIIEFNVPSPFLKEKIFDPSVN